MNDEKVTKTKLYTFAEMKDAVAQVIAEITAGSAHNDSFEDPTILFVMAAVGAKILTELDEKHEKGEL